jgi:hypothetical protein
LSELHLFSKESAMLVVAAALKGYEIETIDGSIGTVKTFLFDDLSWKIRWLVVETGSWLSERQVLLQPSVIGTADHSRRVLPVRLTKAQVEASPDIARDLPVTMQMQGDIYDYYGWDPYWGPDYYGPGGFGPDDGRMFTPGNGYPLESSVREATAMGDGEGDPHLRDMAAIVGYHIHATDGGIGHVENFLLDDISWAIHYMIMDTSNWWMGKHVLISPYAVSEISWDDQQVRLNTTRERVKASPVWDPLKEIDRVYARSLHGHYGWPGSGW